MPAYASYLLTHKLKEFVLVQRENAFKIDLPILAAFKSMSEEEQIKFGMQLNRDFLTNLANNNAGLQIQNSLRQWTDNKLPFDKYSIVTEDIAKTNLLRKKTFLHFLPEYSVDSSQMLQIIEEFDLFLMKNTILAMDTYARLMHEKIEEHTHFIAKLNETLPGAVYIFDIPSGKNIYANDKFSKVVGYTREEMNEMGIRLGLELVHPGDREELQRVLAGMSSLPDGEITKYKYRIKQKDGTYKWIQCFESGFKRDEHQKLSQTVSIVLDIDKEQQIAEQLHESDRLYKQAQSLSKIGSWTFDLITDKITWSDQLHSIYETEDGKVLTAEDWIGWVTEEEREEVMKTYTEALKNKKTFEQIHHIKLPNGKEKSLHRRGEIIFNSENKPVKVIGTTQDISEQDNLQQELKEKQAFISKIADATPSIIASYNVNTGKYVYINEGIEKLLGYSSSEALEKGTAFFGEIIHPDDLSRIMEENTKALQEANDDPDQGDMVKEFTYRMRHRDGEYHWFHTYGTIFDRNALGKVEHVLNISLDVTSQIEANKKIEEQEYFIEHIAEASPTMLYLFNAKTNRFIYLNREIFYVLGYTPEEMIQLEANDIASMYHPEDFNLLPDRTGSSSRFQHHESMMQYECRMKRKGGNWCWLLVREVVFKKDETGGVEQILGTALDINKRKEMERTLIQNSFQLEQSNASLEEFAYVASHDLKEPLRKISTFGDRLEASQKEQLSDNGKIYLKKIVDASQRMQLMIDDLLSVSTISGNRSFELYSLQSILDDVRQTLEFKLEQKGGSIESLPLPEANIVPSQFRQLFQNLLSNSLKFAREGVAPKISVSYQYLQPEDVTNISITKAASYLKLEFVDNGIGFENEFSGKIFQIFQRLHGRSEYEGTGIGLAIVKKIVEHHGGVIYAVGKAGEGSTFTIILPR